MKNISALFIALILVFSCSKNDDAPTQNQTVTNSSFPKITGISVSNTKVGDTIQINGSGFEKNNTYTVTFTENIASNVIEVNTGYLKVIVPENAISGDIYITYNGEKKSIGTISIKIISNQKLYGYNKYPKPYITELDKNTGKEIDTLIQLTEGNNYYDFIYFEDTNEIIVRFETPDPWSAAIQKINIDTKESKTITFPDKKSYTPISTKSKLFGFSKYPTPYITELDNNTGKETDTLIQLIEGNNYYDFIYFEDTNEIIVRFETSDPWSSAIQKINIDTKESKTITFPDKKSYTPISTKSKLFGFSKYPTPYIAELDGNTGKELNTLVKLPEGNNYDDFIYFEKTNEIIVGNGTSYTKINIDTKETKTVNFSENKFYSLINY